MVTHQWTSVILKKQKDKKNFSYQKSSPTGGTWQSLWYPRPQAEQMIEVPGDAQTEQARISRVIGESGDDSGFMKSSLSASPSSASDCNGAQRRQSLKAERFIL